MAEKENHTDTLQSECIQAILEYKDLEQKVRRMLFKACDPFCSVCSECCCNKDFCSESIDSFWLRLIWDEQGDALFQYDGSKGWLLSDGCRLKAGRPPVCYEYLCNTIIEKVSAGVYLDNLKAIAALPALAGKNALGNRHLVTLSPEQILKRTNFAKLRRQIAKSVNLFEQYASEING